MSETMRSTAFAHCKVCGRLYLNVQADMVRCLHAPITLEMDGVRLTEGFDAAPSLVESVGCYMPKGEAS